MVTSCGAGSVLTESLTYEDLVIDNLKQKLKSRKAFLLSNDRSVKLYNCDEICVAKILKFILQPGIALFFILATCV